MYLSRVDLVSDKATKVWELQSELTNPMVEQEEAEGEVNKLRQFQLQNEQGVILGLQERTSGIKSPLILTKLQSGALSTVAALEAKEQWMDLQPAWMRALRLCTGQVTDKQSEGLNEPLATPRGI